MNPNSISHRLFVAALTSGEATPSKRSARVEPKSGSKGTPPKVAQSVSAAARKMSEWSWSGWQHTTI